MTKPKSPRAWNSTIAQRSSPIPRGGRPKARNAKRRSAEWTRAYGSPERVAFVAGLPCVVEACPASPCENAHTSGDGGAGRKSSARYVIPCCRAHHREQHEIGAGSFAIKYQLDLTALSAATELAWQAHWARVSGGAGETPE